MNEPRAVLCPERRRVSLAASAAPHLPPRTALDALQLARAAWERTQQQLQLFSPEVHR